MLIYLSIAWIIGIYIASLFYFPLFLWLLLSLLPLSVAWLWRDGRVRLWAWCGLFVTLGAARYALALPRFDEHSVATYNDRGWVTLVGVAATEPDVRDTYVNLRVRVETLAVQELDVAPAKGIVLVRAPRYPEIQYGDRLRIRGQLETPPIFDTFSYKDYLARSGIYSLVRWAQVDLLERGQGNPFWAAILAFKRHTHNVIAHILPEPSAALLSGILLGVESGLPADLVADFATTGTAHIIAISGFNIAIVSAVVTSLSVRLAGRRYAAWFSTAAIALYTLFVGAAAAVVRAAVMGCVAVWGAHFGRQNSAPNALWATALLMTAWNPHTLWDLGFLLSFAATLGLILFADPLQRRFEAFLARLLPATWVEFAAGFFNESLVLTACAQLTTLPIIVYNFRTLSLVTLLSNILVLPAQTQVMLWGAVATVGGLVWLPLGQALGWIAWLFLSYTIGVVEVTARLPHAALSLRRVSSLWVWGWYGLLAGGSWLMAQTREKRGSLWQAVTRRLPTKALLGGATLAALLAWAALFSLPDGKLHVFFLDVGAGSAIFIETPDGKQLVIDGGASPTMMLAQLGRRMPFWDRSLDLAALTAPQDKHLNGLIPVLERYRVGHVLDNLGACDSAACKRWRALVQQKGLAVQSPRAGAQIDLGRGVRLSVLHPADEPSADAAMDVSNESMALRLDYGQTCFLFVGDLGAEGQTALLARRENVRCDVLQVQRDAQDEMSPALAKRVNPSLVVIAGQADSRHAQSGDSIPEAFGPDAASRVVYTAQYGSIEVISDGQSYDVRVGR